MADKTGNLRVDLPKTQKPPPSENSSSRIHESRAKRLGRKNARAP